ncbi:MAG: methylated-DNA--[protein]-cysteine S-methyltransferase [Zhongshania sp.]|uniref:methylated-DNA--[protein]-cysteine S-methyltransferase n=1 Tax=Zhongshania sp. TaxID=1971902 RepID=UPI00261923A3|nr:methylated-DNA--[protein]-cysteine S-methyltransferase [Zhongshania sp.]MDF1692173.1 methylated-DNA--[protein]-cysteine S-methyltransferase [Zhongshania sp.]
MTEQHINYQRVAKAIHYLSERQAAQPSLAELASHVGLSEFHLQRIFSEWAGISPKQFLQFLTKERAKQQLRKSSVLEAALASGLSGSGRLHDLMIKAECMTPGEYRSLGAGLQIAYSVQTSVFGYCLIAITQRGICKMAFFDEPSQEVAVLQELQQEWPAADLQRDEPALAGVFRQVFSGRGDPAAPLRVLLKGSEFQLKVWEALMAIPHGELCSYQQVAGAMGIPSSVRSVASAIARNHVAYLIPCHRVIRSTGEFSQYRWGAQRKQAMLVHEAAQTLR